MPHRGKPTILIIDDEPAFRTIYRDMFEREGFEVLEADSGETGWQIAKLHKPDLVLLDIVMPAMNGFDVLKKIRSDETTSPLNVIVFSVLGEKDDIQRGLRAGADEYVVKGIFTPQELSKKIYTLLAKKRGPGGSQFGYSHPTTN